MYSSYYYFLDKLAFIRQNDSDISALKLHEIANYVTLGGVVVFCFIEILIFCIWKPKWIFFLSKVLCTSGTLKVFAL